MQWDFYSCKNISGITESIWQDLNHCFAKSNPALDFRMQSTLLEYFGDGDELLGLCHQKGKYISGIIIKPVKLGVWESFLPGQACLCPVILSNDTLFTEIISSLFKAIPGFCWLLKLSKVDSLLLNKSNFYNYTSNDTSDYGTTFSIDIDNDFQKYWRGRSKNLKRNIKKALSLTIEKSIDINLKIFTDTADVRDCVRIHGQLENSGWKGTAGSAIEIDNQQGKFYSRLLSDFTVRENGLIAHLYFDDAPVASLLCIANDSMIIVLKIAYQQQYSEFRPGRLIDYLFLQWCSQSTKLKLADMYTNASKADLSWATDTRTMYDINFYRYGALKLAACSFSYLKQLFKRLKGSQQ